MPVPFLFRACNRQEVIPIQTHKNYYNRESMITAICNHTGYPRHQVDTILHSLSETVEALLSSTDSCTEIRLLPGFKICAVFMPADRVKSNLFENGYVEADDRIRISTKVSSDYKRKINKRNKILNFQLS